MTTPTITPYPDTLPDKGQANAVFDVNVDNFLTWQTVTNGPELAAMITWTQGVADTVLATALAGDLPALTGKALNFIRANAAENGGEFRTPAQVLSDIGATAALALKAPLVSPSFTGTPTGPTAAASTNTTQFATTAQVRLAIPNVLNAAGSAPLYACRAWVNFNGEGVVAIRASGNVSSITDNGTGGYTVNFATAMQDVNYAVIATSSKPGSAGNQRSFNVVNDGVFTTSAVELENRQNDSKSDEAMLFVAIFR